MMTTRIPFLALAAGLAFSASGFAAAPQSTLPEGATIKASFPTDPGKGPEALFDGDPKTFMNPAPNIAAEGKVIWIDLKFAKPIANLSGLETGESDQFHNYYPKAMEFWADSDGNGTFDTLLGKTEKLGPAKQSVGKHLFDGRIDKAHGLRIRVTDQNVAGNRRAFIMNEMKLVLSDEAPLIQPTPAKNSEGDAPKGAASGGGAAPAAKAEPRPIAPDASLVADSADLPGQILPLPQGTKIEASFATEKGKGPEVLFDNDLATFTNPAGGSNQSPEQVSSITLRFPQPVKNLGGIETGESDPFKNYYPQILEFWVDSNGDGRTDTRLGYTDKLGPAKESVGRHLFEGRLDEVHALEIRCVRQTTAGGKRAWMMNEIRLIEAGHLPLATPTPNSYRILYYTQPVPAGTTAEVTFDTEEGKGAPALLDNDPTTLLNGKPGQAKEGKPESIFLRFPAPVKDLAGIRLGGTDPFRNYVWEQMQVHVDTDGDGSYDTLAAQFGGPSAGERRFPNPLPVAHGLELRVTRQSLKGTFRPFMLAGIDGLVHRDDPGDGEMRLVVEDFEDFSSWRTWGNNTNEPKGERLYGSHSFLAGAYRPELARSGKGVGIMRYTFKGGQGSSLWATRGRVFAQEGIIESISFWANPQGYPCSINFEVFDATGKKFRTTSAQLEGSEWNQYTVSLSAKDVPGMATAKYPLKLKHVFMNSKQAGNGDILLDDITLTGVFDRTKRVRIGPVFEGMAYDPARPLTPRYRLSNALDSTFQAELVAELYSSFDPKAERVIKTVKVPVSIDAGTASEVAIDFGQVPQGHYKVNLSLQTDRVSTRHTDELAVTTLNGRRLNNKPMWFGAMHPMGWISHVENQFVLENVVAPLGIDAYRAGRPDQDNKVLLGTDLLFAAGFGSMPEHLRLPNQKNEHRGEPNDYDAYRQYALEQARDRYLPYKDRIISVEFYNEPDLPGFEFLPEIDTYLKMHKVFREAFRQAIPGIRIGTGGNTVQHGKEKKDFNSRMYRELANEADVALWHAHGALENFTGRHKLVEQWLEQGGRPRAQQLLGNSEAGIPSGSSPVGLLNQADNLVKKIGWAKAQPNSLFYIWFTTTDTYDPQGGYLDNENWGLVTYNQRLKPSGQAYNEIIRKLANTTAGGEISLDNRLQTVHFTRDDGSNVYLAWPRERGASFLIRLAATTPVVLTDMFGLARTLTPDQGLITFDTNGYPFYLEPADKGAVAPAAKPDFIAYRDVIGVPPGAEMRLPITLKNTWDQDTRLELAITSSDNKTLAQTTADVAQGAQAQAELTYTMPADLKYGTLGYGLRVRSTSGAKVDQVLPLTIVVAEKAVRVDSVAVDGKPDAIPSATPIVLDKQTDIQDLVADPSTPNWAGPEDLSVRTTVAHDGKGLYVCFDVRDQTHKPGPASDKLWQSDSIQLAFYAGSAHTEVGLTESDGGFGWCWISPDAALAGKKLQAPVSVKRSGDRTIYETYLTFEQLGVKYEPMFPLRMTFLVNEDDGRGRVRIAKWFDGIAAAKDADRMGFLVLE